MLLFGAGRDLLTRTKTEARLEDDKLVQPTVRCFPPVFRT